MDILFFIKNPIIRCIYKFSPLLFPKQKPINSDFGVSMLLCHKDVTMSMYCLQSLFYQIGHAMPVFIVDDGSLRKSDYERLKNMFNAVIETRSNACTKMRRIYSKYPMFIKYLEDPHTSIKKMKFAALFLSPFKKIVCIEPDTLFVNFPMEIDVFKQSPKNYYGVLQPNIYMLFIENRNTELVLRRILFDHLNINTDYLFNGGIMLINKQDLNARTLKRIELFITSSYKLEYQRYYYFEEVLLSTIFDMDKSNPLPFQHFFNMVDFSEYKFLKQKNNENKIMMFHFSTTVRSIIFYKSIKLIYQSIFFREKKVRFNTS